MNVIQRFQKRALRLRVVACAFFFFTWSFFSAAFAEHLLLCPDCGREGIEKSRFCSHCGAALDSVASSDDEPSAAITNNLPELAKPSYTDPMTAAGQDVARARLVASENPALAILLYCNANALLNAENGPKFSEKGARTIFEELEAIRSDYLQRTPSVAKRSRQFQNAQKIAADYFLSKGRQQFGRVWIPSDWPQSLEPIALAAVRKTLPAVCPPCNGMGEVPCKKCSGKGSEPCRESGCKNGYVTRKPTNSLTPNTELQIREKCPSCKGTALVSCKECAGRGNVACRRCHGSGLPPACTTCGGQGYFPCSKCTRSKKGGPVEDCILCRGTRLELCRKCGGDGRVAR